MNDTAVSHAILDRASRLSKARKISAVLDDFGDGLTGRRVLDIGTGAGIIAAYLAERARSVVSVDILDERIEPDVLFLLVRDEELPFKAHSFDVVISNHIIEHVRGQEKHLLEIYRVLADGGICYLATPNRYTPLENHYRLPFLSWPPARIRNLYLKTVKGKPYDIWPLTYGQITRIASRIGFEIRDVSLDLLKRPERYAMGTGLARRGISRLPGWFLNAVHPILPAFVLLLRKPAS